MSADERLTERDRRWMRRALELAERGRCGVSPNPMVGAVVVDPNGDVVGEGFHAACGGDHAEVAALRAAGDRARGATLYVTLEPCNHHGRTPPCSETVLRAGVARVVAAMSDPNPHAEGGAERLSAAGVTTRIGLEREDAERLNRRWLTWARCARPWVTLKAATSLDGRVAVDRRRGEWISGPPARRRSLELREEHDAILVGVGTVLADDPRLTRRLGWNPGAAFLRVILDSRLRTPADARLFAEDPEHVLLLHTDAAPDEARRRFEARGATCRSLPADRAGRVDVEAVAAFLATVPVAALLVEGGPEVHGAFVDHGVCDEVVFFVAPRLIGGREAPTAVAGAGVTSITEALRLEVESVDRRGGDLEIRAVRVKGRHVHGVD